MFNPDGVPDFFPGTSPDVLAFTGAELKKVGGQIRSTGYDVNSSFEGLSTCYQAPEAETLITSLRPAYILAYDFGSDVEAMGGIIEQFGYDMLEPYDRLQDLLERARGFIVKCQQAEANGDDWQGWENWVQEENSYHEGTAKLLQQMMDIQVLAANEIEALIGGLGWWPDTLDRKTRDRFGHESHPRRIGVDHDPEPPPWGTPEVYDAPWIADVGELALGVVDGLTTLLGLQWALQVSGWDWGKENFEKLFGHPPADMYQMFDAWEGIGADIVMLANLVPGVGELLPEGMSEELDQRWNDTIDTIGDDWSNGNQAASIMGAVGLIPIGPGKLAGVASKLGKLGKLADKVPPVRVAAHAADNFLDLRNKLRSTAIEDGLKVPGVGTVLKGYSHIPLLGESVRLERGVPLTRTPKVDVPTGIDLPRGPVPAGHTPEARVPGDSIDLPGNLPGNTIDAPGPTPGTTTPGSTTPGSAPVPGTTVDPAQPHPADPFDPATTIPPVIPNTPLIPNTPGNLNTPGIVGTSGTPGTPGTVGTSGIPGTLGTVGTSGTPGTPGSTGTPGGPGSSGLPGTPDSTHTPGITGQPGHATRPGDGNTGEPGRPEPTDRRTKRDDDDPDHQPTRPDKPNHTELPDPNKHPEGPDPHPTRTGPDSTEPTPAHLNKPTPTPTHRDADPVVAPVQPLIPPPHTPGAPHDPLRRPDPTTARPTPADRPPSTPADRPTRTPGERPTPGEGPARVGERSIADELDPERMSGDRVGGDRVEGHRVEGEGLEHPSARRPGTQQPGTRHPAGHPDDTPGPDETGQPTRHGGPERPEEVAEGKHGDDGDDLISRRLRGEDGPGVVAHVPDDGAGPVRHPEDQRPVDPEWDRLDSAGRMAHATAEISHGARTFASEAEATAWARRHWGEYARDLDPRKADVVERFTRGGDSMHGSYKQVGDHLRGVEHRPELDPLIDEFDEVLDGRRVPEDVVVRRVTDIDHFDGPIDQLVNKTFRDPSFLSTSLGAAIASSRPGIIHLKVPKGTPALYTGHHSAHGEGERELVLGRGLTIKFTRVFPHNGKIHLFAEVVPDVRHIDTPDVRRTPQNLGKVVPDAPHLDHLPPPNPTHRIENPDAETTQPIPSNHLGEQRNAPDPETTQVIPREQLRGHEGAPGPDEQLPEYGDAPGPEATQRIPREQMREYDGVPDPERTQRVSRANGPNPWGRRADAADQPGRGRGADGFDSVGEAPGRSGHGQQPGRGQPAYPGHGQPAHPSQGQHAGRGQAGRAGVGREDQGGDDAWRRREAELYRNQPGEVDGSDPVPKRPSGRTSQQPDPRDIGTYSPQWKDMVDPQRISYDVPQERGRPPRARVKPGDPIFDKFGPKEHQWEQELDLKPPPAYGEPGVHRGDRNRARYTPCDPGQVHQQALTNAAGPVPLHTVPRWKNLLNPNFAKNWIEFKFNCSAVMRATVDLLQGRAVRLADGDFQRMPAPRQGGPGTPIPGDYDDSYEWMGVRGPGHRMDFQPLPGHPNSAADLTDFTRRAYQSVEDGLRGRPVGTVAAICIGWANGGGHWFAAYVDHNGHLRAIDTQPAPNAIDEPWPHVYPTELSRLEFTIREPNGDWEGGSAADPVSEW